MSQKCQTRATNCRFIRSPRQLSPASPSPCQQRDSIAAGLRCRSEDLCRDPAIALQEFHGVAIGILDANGANSYIKRSSGRGDVAPTRFIDDEMILAQGVCQKQAGDLFEPGDLQGEV